MSKALKSAVLAFLLLSSFSILNAQSIKSIKGNVIDVNKEALLGNAIVLSPGDSAFIMGTSFLDGKFEILELDAPKVILKLSSLVFEDTFINVEFEGEENIDLGDIVASDELNTLDEVLVVSKASLIKQKPNGTIEVKISNTGLASSSSVDEILSKSPGIIYDEEGLGVFGKGTAIVFVNGKRVDNERLSTISPSNVEKIEIIRNPSAKYDAEGNAVVNIITKRRSDQGSKVVLKNYLSYNNFAGPQNRVNVDYSYAKKKFSLKSFYGLRVGDTRQILETSRTRNTSGDYFNSDVLTDWQQVYKNFSNYGIGALYDLNKKSYLSLEYSGAYEDLGGNQFNDNTITDTSVGIYSSNIALGELALKNTVNANYFLETDTLGSNLFLGSQFSSYGEDFDNDIFQKNNVDGVDNEFLIDNIGDSKIKISSTQLDYAKVFKNSATLEIGGKIGFVNNRSNTLFFDVLNGEKIKNESASNNFEYNERIPAAYVSFIKDINKKSDFSIGVRGELTDYTLFTSVDNGSTLEDRYLNIFPNFSYNTKFDKVNSYFAYTSRIRRPAYHLLNPFVIYQDAFTSIRGNPELKPAKIHALELGSSYKDWSFSLDYTYTIDPIYGGAFQSPENPKEYILRRANLSREHGYSATVSHDFNLEWWRTSNIVSLSFNNLIDDEGLFEVRANKPYIYLYSQHDFIIKGFATLYFTGWFQSDKQDGIYLRENKSSINLGIERKFFSNKLKCNLDFNDIFQQNRAAGEYNVGNTDIVFARTYNSRYVRLLLSYNFGNLRRSKYKNKAVGKSETRRAK